MKTLFQRYWALLVMLTVLLIIFIAAAAPDWYQKYSVLLWLGTGLLTLFLWINRDQKNS
ncbi:MAG: hypothetical protein JW750_11670 [Anaerolineaceae bacterium]|nr:hypothetical protein [Anaerolineaceae bacterium]